MVSETMGTHKIVQQVNIGGEKQRTRGLRMESWVTLMFRGQVGEKQAD